jgi:class 3 adenylate cyclase
MSSADALAALRMWRDTDVRHVLPQIQAPTLVMHHTQDQDVEVAEARYTADQIPGAVFVELPGVDRTPGDLSAVDRFLSSLREEEAVLDRVLATVMFTDVVDSTAQAAEAGDRHWQELMQHHQSDARALLGRYRGTEMNTTGDGFFATFDGPARGIRCAQAIVEATRKLGIQIRAGLHTGEVQLVGDKAEGMAVNIAARVCAHAGSSEVLASHTVKDLVAGSGLEFQDLGEHQLKGVPDTWRLFRVADA